MDAPSESMDDDEKEELNFRSRNFNPLRALQVDKLTKQPEKVQPLSNIAEYDTFIKKQRARGKSKIESVSEEISSAENKLTESSVLSDRSTIKNTSRLSRLPVPSTVRAGSLQIDEISRSKSSVSCNILSRMEEATKGPAGVLRRCLEEYLKVKVWIRSHRFVRGFCIGYLVAFDRHWNLALVDVDETYRKPESYPTGKRRKKKKTKKRDDEVQPFVKEMPNDEPSSAPMAKTMSPTSKLMYEIFGTTDSVSQDFHDDNPASSPPVEMESESCEPDSHVLDAQISPTSKLVFQIFGEDSTPPTLLKQKPSAQPIDMIGISLFFQQPGDHDNAHVNKDKTSNSEEVSMNFSNTMCRTDDPMPYKNNDKHKSQVSCVRSNPVTCTELKKFKIPKIGKSCATNVKREETKGNTKLSKYSGHGGIMPDVKKQECASLKQEERGSTSDQTGSDIGEKTDKQEARISKKDKTARKCSVKSSSSKDKEGKNSDQRTEKANSNQKTAMCKEIDKLIKHECKDAVQKSNAKKCETVTDVNFSQKILLQPDKARKCSREHRPKTEAERLKESDETGKANTCSSDKMALPSTVMVDTSGDKIVRPEKEKSIKLNKEKSRRHSSERKLKSHQESGSHKSCSTVSVNKNVQTEIVLKSKSVKAEKKIDQYEERSRKSSLERKHKSKLKQSGDTSTRSMEDIHRSKIKSTSSEKESKHYHSQVNLEKQKPIISMSSVEKEASSIIPNVERRIDLRVGNVESLGNNGQLKQSQEKKQRSHKSKDNSDSNVESLGNSGHLKQSQEKKHRSHKSKDNSDSNVESLGNSGHLKQSQEKKHRSHKSKDNSDSNVESLGNSGHLKQSQEKKHRSHKSKDNSDSNVESLGNSGHLKQSQEKKHRSHKSKDNSDSNVVKDSSIKCTAAKKENQPQSRSRKHSHERKQKPNIEAAKDKIESENCANDKTSKDDNYQSFNQSNTDMDVVCSHKKVMSIEVEMEHTATSLVEIKDRSDTEARIDKSETQTEVSDRLEIDEAAAMVRNLNLADIKLPCLDTHTLSSLCSKNGGLKLDHNSQIKAEPILVERDTEVASVISDGTVSGRINGAENTLPNTLTSATDITVTTPEDRPHLESNESTLLSGKAIGNKDECKQPATGQPAKAVVYLHRHVNQLFIRGDNVVIINVLQ